MPPEYTVTRLSTTPAKGLMLHHPDSIELTTQGAVGDRVFFLVDDEGGLQSCTRNPGLYGLSAAYDAQTQRLEVRRGDEVLHTGVVEAGDSVDTDMWGLRTLPGDVVADPTWSTLFSDVVGRRVHLVRARGSAFDVEPVTLLGTASVAELAARAELAEVDSRRFRMLIEFEGGEAHVEDSWGGELLQVGEAVLRVDGPVKRCAATTRNADSGAVDLQTLRMITGNRGRQESVLGLGAASGSMPRWSNRVRSRLSTACHWWPVADTNHRDGREAKRSSRCVDIPPPRRCAFLTRPASPRHFALSDPGHRHGGCGAPFGGMSAALGMMGPATSHERNEIVPTDDGAAASDKAWRWIALALVFVVLSPITAALTRSASGTTLVVLIVVQALATGLAFLIPQARQIISSRSEATAEEREIDARVETRVAMNDALDPILRLLGALALEPDAVVRNQMRAQAIPLVLKTASEFIGPDRSRACWFRLEAGPPKQLVPDQFAGRAGSPSTTFTESTASGDAAIGMVLADEDLLCEDIESTPPPGWDSTKQRDYATFISVSVIAGDTAYGMLTLDALETGDLTEEDKGLLRLLAGVLAVALSVP